jgi:hypothetical protein
VVEAADRSGPSPWWVWVLRCLPAAAFLATFGVFLVDKGREARTVLGSGRGLLTVGIVVAGYVAIGLTLKALVRWTWVPPLVLTGVVFGLAAWIVRPYYVDETADRRLLTGPVTDAPPPPGPGEGAVRSIPGPPATAAGPVRVSTGTLQGIDHDASGTASVIRNPDGALVVRFADFAIEGTPDPRVYLVPGEDERRPGGTELGGLEGNQGEVLDYAVPDDVDPTAGPGWTVLVWCRAFSVPIANASQSPP